MTIKIAINGLGRIGRCVLRSIFELNRKEFEIVSVNGPAPAEDHAHLLKYDSVHGVFPGEISYDDKNLIINNTRIPLQRERELTKLNWKDVDVLLECTGRFNEKEAALTHINSGGAKKVIVSAPCKNADSTIVYGVNNQALKKEHQVISIGSCTTNALSPVAKVLNDNIGIESGFMTTIHSYTNDQRILDGSHKDPRRARSAALSMIPSSTGAAKALGLVLPELEGKLDGSAIRVPTPNVSMIDLSFTASRDTSVEEINNIILSNSNDILGVAKAKLVSIDFTHNTHSSIFDPFETKVINKRFCRVVAWYDNEWGFSVRMLDIAALFTKLI
ncbi:MAG: type I glyceraldehyde-3-phosphate dehydrogenase [Rickettsiales bacterium]|jgi:glyceraldehyde 3-phosphate dehydrogenase|nr:type I glyceraldehyde-3-phosphate dehydrogenase [Rickettsiales bacterium]